MGVINNMKRNFNFSGLLPEDLYPGKTIMLCTFYRDENSNDPEWSASKSYMKGPYKVLSINHKDDNKWQIKFIATKLSFGINSRKGYYSKTRLTFNSKGQSQIMSCSSSKGVYSRTIIYNCIVG